MTPIALADCPSLIDFLLTADDVGPTVMLNGVSCAVEQIDGQHAHFEFIGPAFGCSVVAPGWYVGEHVPVHVLIVGDTEACLRWMPIDPNDKRALIQRLPFDQTDKFLLKLSV